jgi:hypothetical protein
VKPRLHNNPNLTPLANAMINDMKKSFAKHCKRSDSQEYIEQSRIQLMNWYMLVAVINGMDKEHLLAEMRGAALHAEELLQPPSAKPH